MKLYDVKLVSETKLLNDSLLYSLLERRIFNPVSIDFENYFQYRLALPSESPGRDSIDQSP